jgi:hypothetical protein
VLNAHTSTLIRSWVTLLLKGWRDITITNSRTNEQKKAMTNAAHLRSLTTKMKQSREMLFNLKRQKVRLMSTYLGKLCV